MKVTVGIVKDFDKGWQIGGGAARRSVKSTVKQLRDKTRETERWGGGCEKVQITYFKEGGPGARG